MLDMKWIRENPEKLKSGLSAKGVSVDIDLLLNLDLQRRALIKETEDLKAERNKANDEIVNFKKAGEKGKAEAKIAEMKTLSQKAKENDAKVGDIDIKIANLAYFIPNIPKNDVAVGKADSANKVIRAWRDPNTLQFNGLDHLTLASAKGWISMDKGSKITGAGFPVYQGVGARLERALINFMLDFHTSRHGYLETWAPALVNRDSMFGTGQLPKMEEDMYRLKDEEFFLIPTAEVPLTNLYRDEILNEDELPLKITGYTPCFRREAGSYGKDTRGLSRVHQFDKVELVQLVKPEDSDKALETLTGEAEAILQALELPYRVVMLGTGDLSFAAAKCYDLEVWAPVTKKWFEVSSCSTFCDFQARRANIRYRSKTTGKPEYVHTLNGSGLALPRIVLCLLENFQKENGDVEFPAVLQKYLKA